MAEQGDIRLKEDRIEWLADANAGIARTDRWEDADVPGFLIEIVMDEFSKARLREDGMLEFQWRFSPEGEEGQWFTVRGINETLNQLPENRFETEAEAQEAAAQMGEGFEARFDEETGRFLVTKRQEDKGPVDRFFDSRGEAARAAIELDVDDTHEPVFDNDVWRLQPIEEAPKQGQIRPAEEFGGPAGSFVAIQPDGSIRPFDFNESQALEQPDFFANPETGQTFVRGSKDQPWRLLPNEAPTTIEQMIVDALVDGGEEGQRRAQTLFAFQNQPTDTERLGAALQIATSPSDYFTLMAIARGEIEPIISDPFDSKGRLQRVAPMASFLQESAQRFFGAGPFGEAIAGGMETPGEAPSAGGGFAEAVTPPSTPATAPQTQADEAGVALQAAEQAASLAEAEKRRIEAELAIRNALAEAEGEEEDVAVPTGGVRAQPVVESPILATGGGITPAGVPRFDESPLLTQARAAPSEPSLAPLLPETMEDEAGTALRATPSMTLQAQFQTGLIDLSTYQAALGANVDAQRSFSVPLDLSNPVPRRPSVQPLTVAPQIIQEGSVIGDVQTQIDVDAMATGSSPVDFAAFVAKQKTRETTRRSSRVTVQ